jgi:hypothetical protein
MQRGRPYTRSITPLTPIGEMKADICCRIVVPTLLHMKLPSVWGNVDAISCYFTEYEDKPPGSTSPRTIGNVLRNGTNWASAPSQILCSTAFALTEAFPEKMELVTKVLINDHGPFSLVVVGCCDFPVPYLCRSIATYPTIPSWIIEYAVDRAHIKENIQTLMDIMDTMPHVNQVFESKSETDLKHDMGPTSPKNGCSSTPLTPTTKKVKVPRLLCSAVRTIAHPMVMLKHHVQHSARDKYSLNTTTFGDQYVESPNDSNDTQGVSRFESHGDSRFAHAHGALEKQEFMGYPLKHSKSTPNIIVGITSPRIEKVPSHDEGGLQTIGSPKGSCSPRAKSDKQACAQPKKVCTTPKPKPTYQLEIDTEQWKTMDIYDPIHITRIDGKCAPHTSSGFAIDLKGLSTRIQQKSPTAISSKTPRICEQDLSPPNAM